MTTQRTQPAGSSATSDDDVRRMLEESRSSEDILEWLEKMAVVAEKRYIITSYPAMNTQAVPERA